MAKRNYPTSVTFDEKGIARKYTNPRNLEHFDLDVLGQTFNPVKFLAESLDATINQIQKGFFSCSARKIEQKPLIAVRGSSVYLSPEYAGDFDFHLIHLEHIKDRILFRTSLQIQIYKQLKRIFSVEKYEIDVFFEPRFKDDESSCDFYVKILDKRTKQFKVFPFNLIFSDWRKPYPNGTTQKQQDLSLIMTNYYNLDLTEPKLVSEIRRNEHILTQQEYQKNCFIFYQTAVNHVKRQIKILKEGLQSTSSNPRENHNIWLGSFLRKGLWDEFQKRDALVLDYNQSEVTEYLLNAHKNKLMKRIAELARYSGNTEIFNQAMAFFKGERDFSVLEIEKFATDLSTEEQISAFVAETIYFKMDELPPAPPKLCDQIQGLEHHKIDIGNGLQLYVETQGPKDAPPIILLNGGPGSTHYRFHPYFSEAANFSRVIYYDRRGCGQSSYQTIGTTYSLDQMVEDLEKIRENLHLEKWTVLGHSFGGLLAQYYATKHPERVAGLVLVCAMPAIPKRQIQNVESDPNIQKRQKLGLEQSAYRNWLWSQPKIKKLEEYKKKLVILQLERKKRPLTEEEKRRYEELLKIFKGKTYNFSEQDIKEYQELLRLLVFNNFLHNNDWKRQDHPEKKPTFDDITQITFYHDVDPYYRIDIVNDLSSLDLEGCFKKSNIPTLIIEGRLDITWDTKKLTLLHEEHPSSRLVIMENSAHSPFMDEPENFFAELSNFISTINPLFSPKPRSSTIQTMSKDSFHKQVLGQDVDTLGIFASALKDAIEETKAKVSDEYVAMFHPEEEVIIRVRGSSVYLEPKLSADTDLLLSGIFKNPNEDVKIYIKAIDYGDLDAQEQIQSWTQSRKQQAEDYIEMIRDFKKTLNKKLKIGIERVYGAEYEVDFRQEELYEQTRSTEKYFKVTNRITGELGVFLFDIHFLDLATVRRAIPISIPFNLKLETIDSARHPLTIAKKFYTGMFNMLENFSLFLDKSDVSLLEDYGRVYYEEILLAGEWEDSYLQRAQQYPKGHPEMLKDQKVFDKLKAFAQKKILKRIAELALFIGNTSVYSRAKSMLENMKFFNLIEVKKLIQEIGRLSLYFKILDPSGKLEEYDINKLQNLNSAV